MTILDYLQLPDHKIEFGRDNISHFNTEYSKYICTINILSNLSVKICSIIISDVEVANLLDNIYFYLDYNHDTMYSFSIDCNSIQYTVSFYKEYGRDYMAILSTDIKSNDFSMVLVAKLDITDNIIPLADKLYHNYIIDSDIEYDSIFYLNPENHINTFMNPPIRSNSVIKYPV